MNNIYKMIELKDIDLLSLNKNMLIQSLRNYFSVENNKRLTNLKKLDINKLIEQIYKYDVNIEVLFNNYYKEIEDQNIIKKIEHKKNLQNVEDKIYKYNSLVRSNKIKLEYEKNRITEEDKTKEINFIETKIKFYENKILKLNEMTYNNLDI